MRTISRNAVWHISHRPTQSTVDHNIHSDDNLYVAGEKKFGSQFSKLIDGAAQLFWTLSNFTMLHPLYRITIESFQHTFERMCNEHLHSLLLIMSLPKPDFSVEANLAECCLF